MKKKLLIFSYCSGLLNFIKRVGKKKKSLSISVMFHGVYQTNFENLPKDYYFGMHLEDFETILKWFSKEKLKIISTEEFLNGEPGVHLTFDDGYANNYYFVLPILEKYNFPSLIFVTTQHLRQYDSSSSRLLDFFQEKKIKYEKAERKKLPREFITENWSGLTFSQLQKLSDSPLIEIGCHTVSHPHLSKLSYEEQMVEIMQSKKCIEDIINEPLRYFSYPFGDYDQNTINILKKTGFKAAFAVQPKKRIMDGNYQHPRIGLYQSTPYYLNAKIYLQY